MKGRKISSGSFANIDYETREYNGEHIHIMKVMGPINREHRIPFYYQTLENNPSADYFVILDNRRGHEDNFSYDDMQIVADILLDAGIKRIHGAIITREFGYDNILKLARAVAKVKTLESHTEFSENMTDAENFILSRIETLARVG
ncbi:hypothetical protein [Sneathiella sp.]|uniref:hypothetical protein n=1 Tax=Sneathiella sp. TaxID=1964365 RepID=UPI002607A21A|nr:hypothetical protein [Sneathiella sp.]MDF2366809.1 hypothetical protein [Sneathiella sp.]